MTEKPNVRKLIKKKIAAKQRRATAISLLSLFVLGLILILRPPPEVLEVKCHQRIPFEITPKNKFEIFTKSIGAAPKVILTIKMQGQAVLETAGVRYDLNELSDNCEKIGSDLTCRLVLNIRKNRQNILIYSTEATIESYSVDVVKYQNRTTLNKVNAKIAGFFIFLVLLTALFFHKNQILSEWLLIGLTIIFIAFNDILFAFAVIGFLSVCYKFRRHLPAGVNSLKRLMFAIFIAISFLLFFKYSKEVIWSIFANPGQFDLLMPIGVSYIIIRLIDTFLRWYRGQEIERSYREFLLFMIFPGTLIAGPIEDMHSFYRKRLSKISSNDYAYGINRILIGLFKKIVVADSILYPIIHGKLLKNTLWLGSGSSVNSIILNPSEAGGAQIMAFALSGLLYAYVDFSAYSDMAIGFSRLLGYRILENFNFPIFAVNIREYWKRWHISLSDWSFRNIYFPLLIKTHNSYIPLYFTMLTIGLWHAFNMTWFLWALHHATGMTIIALIEKKRGRKAIFNGYLKPIGVVLTVLFAAMGFVFVYFSDYKLAVILYTRIIKSIFFLN